MEDGSDKLTRFQEAFERGQEGEISNFEAWLKDHRVSPDKVDLEYLDKYFQEHPDEAVNHEEQLEEVAEHIGYFSRRSNLYHLPIIGVTGIGKTQFIHTVSKLLERIEPGIQQRIYAADTFSEVGEDEERIFEIRDELQELDQVLIQVDDCEWAESESLVESLRIIEATVDDALLVTTWTPEYWKHYAEDVEQVVSTSTEVHLTPFSKGEVGTAINQLFEVVSDDGREIPEEAANRLYEYSGGVPGVFTRLVLTSVREAFVKELELGSVESVDAAAEKTKLLEAKQSVYELSDTKLTILTHLLLWSHRRGIRPSQLVDLLDRDKSTVSYHLQELKDENVVESEKQGRSAYYRVREQVKPFVQMRIDQRGEFHG